MRYERHIFVCTNSRDPEAPRGCCAAKDSEEIRIRLKQLVKDGGLKSVVRINSSGCLDACEFGPIAVVYPEGQWYGELKVEDCEEFFQRVIKDGNVLARRLVEHPQFNRVKSRAEASEEAPADASREDEQDL